MHHPIRAVAACSLLVTTSACLPFQTSQDAGISYSTESVAWDGEVMCLGDDVSGEAMELLNTDDFIVVVASGEGSIPRSEWDAFDPGWGWQKNSTRTLQFTRSCFSRSPNASPDCEGEACGDVVEVGGYSWIELSQILAVDCLPSGEACNPMNVGSGELAFIVIRKCHQVTFEGEVVMLEGPDGERAVLHAAADGAAPTTQVDLPDGWSLSKQTLEEPLVVHPFGGEGGCYYNVIRDGLDQSYHQIAYSGSTYP